MKIFFGILDWVKCIVESTDLGYAIFWVERSLGVASEARPTRVSIRVDESVVNVLIS